MNEPSVPSSPVPPVESLTSEQATAEIAQMRGDVNGDLRHEGRPGHDAALGRLNQLYERAHAGADQEGQPDAVSPDEKLANVLHDPYAEPRTAADLAQRPPPEFSPEAKKNTGLSWDESKLARVYATAEQEDLVPLVREGQRLLTRLAAGPVPDSETADRQLIQEWGRSFHAKMDAVERAEALFMKQHPDDAAVLERTGLAHHPEWLRYLARVGERMVDPSTRGGYARIKVTYMKVAEAAARDAYAS